MTVGDLLARLMQSDIRADATVLLAVPNDPSTNGLAAHAGFLVKVEPVDKGFHVVLRAAAE